MIVLILAGFDPTGGAGISRDVATCRTIDPSATVYAVQTAVTLQGDGFPARSRAIEPHMVLESIAATPRPDVVKLGLIPDILAAPLAEVIVALDAPVVLDPVMWASDGGQLGATAVGLQSLSSIATVLTPNHIEAWELAPEIDRAADPEELLRGLAEHWKRAAVLLKNAPHARADRVIDRLYVSGRIVSFERPRLPGPDVRGTGCALSTAIACRIGRGRDIVDACGWSIRWLDEHRRRTRTGSDGRPHMLDP